MCSLRCWWAASTDATGIQGYRVYRAPSADGPFTEITARLVNATGVHDVELMSATPYFYQVAAVDGTGNTGQRSAVVSAAAQVGSGLPLFGTLAYEAGKDIRLRDLPAGEERAIAGTSNPRFAADGSRLYFQSDNAISFRPPSGGDTTIFQPLAGVSEYDIAADNQRYGAIIFRQFASAGPFVQCNVTEPHAFNELGQEIYTSEYDYGSELALSANHRWLVYRYIGFCNVAAVGSTNPGDLCVLDLNAKTRTCLEGADYRDADFAPTGNGMVFAANLTGQYEIWKAEMQESGVLTNYIQLTRGPQGQPSREPAWSTDGRWIIFQRDMEPSEAENWRLFAVRADGAALRPLDIVGVNPAWLGGTGSDPGGLTNRVYLPAIRR